MASPKHSRHARPQLRPDQETALRACNTVGDMEQLAGVTDRFAFWDDVVAVARKRVAHRHPTCGELMDTFRLAIRERLAAAVAGSRC